MSTTNKVQLLVKTQLQEDWVANQPVLLGSGNQTPSLITNVDQSGRVVAYYIDDNKVYVAYKLPLAIGNTSPGWTTEDTKFPSSSGVKPVSIRVSYFEGFSGNCVACRGSDNQVYVLKAMADNRFSSWEKLPNLPADAKNLVTAIPFVAVDDKLRVLAHTSNEKGKYAGYFIDYPKPNGSYTWTQDKNIKENATQIVVDRALGSRNNETAWGYVESLGDTSKTTSLLSTTTYSKERYLANTVAEGNYTSACHVRLPTNNAQPLIFAIDVASKFATYFKAAVDSAGKATTEKVSLFGNANGGYVKVKKIAACLRSGVSPHGVQTQWIEVFGIDEDNDLIHVESIPKEPTSLTSIYLLSTGEYAVNKWSDAAVIAKATADLSLSSAGDGNASLVTTSTDSQPTLLHFTQDPATTAWHVDSLKTPVLSAGTPATKKKVYYVETTVFDRNNIRMPNLLATIETIQQCNININGISTSIDPQRSFTTVTNSSGKLTFTVDAGESLSAPTFSVWVEGMEQDHVVDVNPSGDIQQMFRTITSSELGNAKDQTDDTSVFPSTTSTQNLEDIAKALNTLMLVSDPSTKAKPVAKSASQSQAQGTTGTSTGQRSREAGQPDTPLSFLSDLPPYVHKETSLAVAHPRSRLERTLGQVRGNAGQAFILTLEKGNPRLDSVSPEEAKKAAASDSNKPTFFFSLGDLWNDVQNGVATVTKVIGTTVADGIKVVVSVTKTIKDAAKTAIEGVVNGVIHFVSQAFDLVMGLFKAAGATLQKIFNWLFYMLPGLKPTVAVFEALLKNFTSNATSLYVDTFPKKAEDLADKAKKWLDDNLPSAKTHMDGGKVTTYDKDGPDAAAQSDDGHGLLDRLPSTATWLFNKFFNTDGASSGSVQISGASDFVKEWTVFLADLDLAAMGKDLKAALQELSSKFHELADRSTLDLKPMSFLLDICSAVLYLAAVVFKGLVRSFSKMATKAIALLDKFWNSKLDIPVLSSIFKAVTGQELLLKNVVIYILAIPFTIAFKILQGDVPFKSAVNDKGDVDFTKITTVDTNISRGILYNFYTFVDLYQDFIGANMPFNGNIVSKIPKVRENSPACLKSLLKGTSFFLCASQLVLESPSLPTDNRLLLSAGLGYSDLTFQYGFGLYSGFIRLGRGDRLGAVLETLFGVANLGPAVWHVVEVVNEAKKNNTTVSGSTDAILASEFLATISGTAKFLSLFRNPYTYAALFVCDSASDIGAGAARIVAAKLAT